ncbi:class IIb bacteriocin, lactobin A/cerein 7B family [Pedobacter alpinus]|uniref:Class IIb bacteriocin, lactobin A/cerein 7B family n=1 Tax=Pedobacter alpinus TaxID=1590643 RepID=A0ABW5TMV1_9SPHI
MKNLELEGLGLVEMKQDEMLAVDGGRLPWWAWALWGIALVGSLILADNQTEEVEQTEYLA